MIYCNHQLSISRVTDITSDKNNDEQLHLTVSLTSVNHADHEMAGNARTLQMITYQYCGNLNVTILNKMRKCVSNANNKRYNKKMTHLATAAWYLQQQQEKC